MNKKNSKPTKARTTRRRYSVLYFIKLASLGIIRNSVMSFASILILTSCLLVMGSFWTVTQIIDDNIELLDGYNRIVAFIDYDADDTTIASIGEKIKALPNVEDVEFISREQGLASEKEKYGEEYSELFDNYLGVNPLKNSYSVSYKNTSGVQSLVYNIQQIDGIDTIYNRVDIAETIDNYKNVISFIFSWLMILLLIVSMFVIINTIKASVYVRRDEISIMSCVGATGFFITLPYMIEGFFIGVLSSFFAYFGQMYIHKYMFEGVIGSSNMIQVMHFNDVKYYFIFGFLIIGVLTSVICSMLPVRKYRKV